MKSFEHNASSTVNRLRSRRFVASAVALVCAVSYLMFSEKEVPEVPTVTAVAPAPVPVPSTPPSDTQEKKTDLNPISSGDRQTSAFETAKAESLTGAVPPETAPILLDPIAREPVLDRSQREDADRRILEQLEQTQTLVPRYQTPITLLAPDVRRRLTEERAFRDAVIGVALEFNRSVEINASDRLELGLYREQSMRADTELPIIYKRLSVPKHETLSRERIEAIKANEHLGACDAFGDLFEQGYIMVYEVYFKNPYRPPMYFKMDRESCRKYEERHLELPPLDALEASLRVPSSGF